MRPSRQTLSSRIVRANLLVAVVTALSLAGAAGAVSWILWQARETRRVNESADLLAQALRSEVREEHPRIADAARDVFQDGAVPGYRVEVWQGETLIVANQPGSTVGPPERPGRSSAQWIVASRPIEEGAQVVVAAPREHGLRALSVFLFSLGLAAPFCLSAAWLVGRYVSRQVTRPLEEFRERVIAARPGEDFPVRGHADPPLEVLDLEQAFQELWNRLAAALAREREFAANASHELRMPLTRIRLHLERALERTAAGDLADVSAATGEIARTVRLLESLLVLARDPAAGVPAEAVNVADVVRQAARRVFPEESVHLEAPDEAMVRGDEDLVSIAVFALLENARKFSAPGRAIQLSLDCRRERVAFGVTSPGARVAASDRERVFDRFFRGPEARATVEGHGLGLSLCRHIARLHRGDVQCVSAPDEDARFLLDLPAWMPLPVRESGRAPAGG